jgi:hypothetical protein
VLTVVAALAAPVFIRYRLGRSTAEPV